MSSVSSPSVVIRPPLSSPSATYSSPSTKSPSSPRTTLGVSSSSEGANDGGERGWMSYSAETPDKLEHVVGLVAAADDGGEVERAVGWPVAVDDGGEEVAVGWPVAADNGREEVAVGWPVAADETGGVEGQWGGRLLLTTAER